MPAWLPDYTAPAPPEQAAIAGEKEMPAIISRS